MNEYILTQNYPNPFNNQSRFNIVLNQPEMVELNLYNILGEHQKEIFKGKLAIRINTFTIDGTDLATGMYLYVIRIGARTQAKKCLLIK